MNDKPTSPALNQALSVQMPFGKFRGKTMRDILEEEPGYMCWLKDKADRTADDPDRLRSDRLRDAVIEVYKTYGPQCEAWNDANKERWQ